jgi:glycogen synthase
LKILMLSWEYPPRIIGGLARHVHDLSVALVQQGHEVEVITGDHVER